MSALGNPAFERARPPAGGTAERKSASHGEAGYVRKERDFYATEPWVTRALLAAFPRNHFDMRPEHLIPVSEPTIWEPACGDGRMAAELVRGGYKVIASDIHDYGWPGTIICDFLREAPPSHACCGAIITNPPFDIAVAFIQRALQTTKWCKGKVAILQRHEFDAPVSHHPLFERPFAAKLVLPRRPRWSDDDKASPRFPYAWFIWDWRHESPPILRYLPDPDRGPPAASGRLL